MIHFKKIILILILFILSACSSIPKNTQNSCAIFEERYLWYKHAKASYEKWGAPIHLQLAFVKKESDFNWLAKPPRKKLFKVTLSIEKPPHNHSTIPTPTKGMALKRFVITVAPQKLICPHGRT